MAQSELQKAQAANAKLVKELEATQAKLTAADKTIATSTQPKSEAPKAESGKVVEVTMDGKKMKGVVLGSGNTRVDMPSKSFKA